VSALSEAVVVPEGSADSHAHGLNPADRARVEGMQRARLLSAMTTVATERGFAEASVARVVKRAGVSRRTFYDLYEDREACLLAAFEHAIARLGERVVPAFRLPARWCERVRAALAELLAAFDAEPALARLCLVEVPKGAADLLGRRRAVLDALALAVDEGRGEARSSSPPPLTAESTVGGTVAVVQARLLAQGSPSLLTLINPLMAMIVHPYLGPAAARRELERPSPEPVEPLARDFAPEPAGEPFAGLPIRITFRTARVLATVGSLPGASNRDIAHAAEVSDQGQMSKLLRRLERAGLIDNDSEGQARGERNAWRLTRRGEGILHTVGAQLGGKSPIGG
jgi:AcrR family transcriptional regulator